MKRSESQPWRADAKCRGDDPRKWDTANLSVFTPQLDAHKLCEGCPVITECRLDAELAFSVSPYLGLFEVDSKLVTSGVVRGGKVYE